MYYRLMSALLALALTESDSLNSGMCPAKICCRVFLFWFILTCFYLCSGLCWAYENYFKLLVHYYTKRLMKPDKSGKGAELKKNDYA